MGFKLRKCAGVMVFIESNHPMGRDVGFVDAHRFAAVALAGDATSWPYDRRLRVAH